MTFKELAIGETFRFTTEFTMRYSGMKTGLCQKISKRKYKYVADGMECEVGTITVEVVRASE